MRLSVDLLLKKWNSVNYHDGGYLRVDTAHPLEWYVGYAGADRKTLLLISAMDPGAVSSSKSISVQRGKRTDGRWTLSLELLRNKQEGVFVQLCCDIIEYSRNFGDEQQALHAAVQRYRQWDKLLERQSTGLLEERERKGLLGEILFLKRRLKLDSSFFQAVSGWIGPDGADQDFVYSDGWHEVKTVSASSQTVEISSIEQLSARGPGELEVMAVDKTAPEHPAAFSLRDAVQEVRTTLQDDADASALFESKLLKYGYIDLLEYGEQKYVVSWERAYEVNCSFPVLKRGEIAVQIVSAEYALDLAGLERWLKRGKE
jgi:hypothetical protein